MCNVIKIAHFLDVRMWRDMLSGLASIRVHLKKFDYYIY
jgi:hypothetical protein